MNQSAMRLSGSAFRHPAHPRDGTAVTHRVDPTGRPLLDAEPDLFLTPLPSTPFRRASSLSGTIATPLPP